MISVVGGEPDFPVVWSFFVEDHVDGVVGCFVIMDEVDEFSVVDVEVFSEFFSGACSESFVVFDCPVCFFFVIEGGVP